jgi:hypothetical protein
LEPKIEIRGVIMVELKRTKEEIVKKAGGLGAEYESKYRGCAQCTFLAIVDALRWGGLEIIPQNTEESLFSGLALLSGGVGMTGDGSCGAVTAGVLAIGMALGLSREKLMDSGVRRMAYDTAKGPFWISIMRNITLYSARMYRGNISAKLGT